MDPVASFVTPIVIGFISAFFGSLVAFRKFKAEKMWERKEKAYVEIIDSLYNLLRHCEVHKEDYGQGTGLSDAKLYELRNNYNSAFWAIKKSTDIGAFIISTRAHNVLKELNNRGKLDWDSNPSFDIYEHEYQHFQTALNQIVQIAKIELSVEKV